MDLSSIPIDYSGLGKRIKKSRKAAGFTQQTLSEKAGISLSFLGHIERGGRKASIETLVHIALALNVSLDALMTDTMALGGRVEATPDVLRQAVKHAVEEVVEEALDIVIGRMDERTLLSELSKVFEEADEIDNRKKRRGYGRH